MGERITREVEVLVPFDVSNAFYSLCRLLVAESISDELANRSKVLLEMAVTYVVTCCHIKLSFCTVSLCVPCVLANQSVCLFV